MRLDKKCISTDVTVEGPDKETPQAMARRDQEDTGRNKASSCRITVEALLVNSRASRMDANGIVSKFQAINQDTFPASLGEREEPNAASEGS